MRARLHEVNRGGEVEKIYSESRVEGTMEFEPTGMRGELSAVDGRLLKRPFKVELESSFIFTI